MSLNNLSNQQSDAGDRAGALATITEATQLDRALATTNPAAFTPDLDAPRGASSYPQHSWEELGGRFLDLMADLESKDEGNSSLPEKQRSCPGVWGEVLRDPRDMAKA